MPWIAWLGIGFGLLLVFYAGSLMFCDLMEREEGMR